MGNPNIFEGAEALGLGPFRQSGREWVCKATWRNGDGWNVAINEELGVWTDRTGKARGGRLLRLAETVLGETEGRRWFRDRYGSRTVPCHKARRVPVVPDELLRRMVAALADSRKQVAGEDEAEFALWCQVDRIARAGGPEWRKFRERVEIADAELYRHWIRCAVEFEADSKRAAALIVGMLAETCR